VKDAFSPRSKVFIPLQPGVSGLGPECPGNPECPAPNPGYSAPPETSEQIFKEYGFCIDLEGFLCDKCEAEQYQHFGLVTIKQGEQ
jgi:hypothetical protein